MATGLVRTEVTVPRKKIDLHTAIILHLIFSFLHHAPYSKAINFSDIFLSISLCFRKFLCSGMFQKPK